MIIICHKKKVLRMSHLCFQEINSTDTLKLSKQQWSLFPSDKLTLQFILPSFNIWEICKLMTLKSEIHPLPKIYLILNYPSDESFTLCDITHSLARQNNLRTVFQPPICKPSRCPRKTSLYMLCSNLSTWISKGSQFNLGKKI